MNVFSWSSESKRYTGYNYIISFCSDIDQSTVRCIRFTIDYATRMDRYAHWFVNVLVISELKS